MDEFRIRFRGVRGSYPTPGAATIRYGGNTPCVEVRANGHVLAIDAGSGLISLGADLMREYMSQPPEERGRLYCTILLTHMHHDHIQGYPFFGPLYTPQAKVHVFGPRMTREDLAGALSGTMVPPYFPVDAESLSCERVIRAITDLDAIVYQSAALEPEPQVMSAMHLHTGEDELVVRVYHSLAHPRGGCFVYRLEYGGKIFVYATDIEGYVGGDSRLVRFAKGADVLVHDAAYRESEYLAGFKQGWGHSTIDMAVDVARQANVKQLILFHHAPTNDDDVVDAMEREARALYPNTIAAYEGLEITL